MKKEKLSQVTRPPSNRLSVSLTYKVLYQNKTATSLTQESICNAL